MITRSVANSNAMLVGIFNFDVVVANGIVAVHGASSFRKCFKQSAIPLLQSTQMLWYLTCNVSPAPREQRLWLCGSNELFVYLSQLPKNSLCFLSRNELFDDILAQNGIGVFADVHLTPSF